MKILFALPLVALVASCAYVKIDDETVRDMPTGFMCNALNSDEWLVMPKEQIAIYKELERRGETCVSKTERVIIKKE